jgi:hypothetical protein
MIGFAIDRILGEKKRDDGTFQRTQVTDEDGRLPSLTPAI